jgi:hypothetical protein
MWQKERLLNLAIQSLPPEVDKVAWIDADIVFENPSWFSQTEAKLDDYPVVQPFQVAHSLDAEGNIELTRLGWVKALGHPLSRLARHRGCAWAARRELLENGLFDRAILGSGDALMLLPWCQVWHPQTLALFPSKFLKCFYEWARPQSLAVRGNLGYVSGEVYQLFHGSRENRRYNRRHSILREHDFDPLEDIILDSSGVWKWATDKPRLHADVRRYFYERGEDG